jgi:hypothetical protein
MNILKAIIIQQEAEKIQIKVKNKKNMKIFLESLKTCSDDFYL